jgi:hypothetical protein
MNDTTSTFTPLAERLASGDLLALLGGLSWDHREDMELNHGGILLTVVSAVAGTVHVKARHSTASPDAVMLMAALTGTTPPPYPADMVIHVDTHSSPEEAIECHRVLITNIRAEMTTAALADAVAEAQRVIDGTV